MSEKKRIIKNLCISILIVLMCYLLSIIFGNFVYDTNDDTSIQSLLSGNTTGSPYPGHQFINIALGLFISFLYKLIPAVQWWFVYSHTLLLIGIFLINYSLIKMSETKRNKILTIVSLICLNIIFLLYTVNRISFSLVPTIFGTGIICYLATNEINLKKCIYCYLLYFLMLFHRSQPGKIIFAYLTLLVIFMCLTIKDKSLFKKCLVIITVALIWTKLFTNLSTNYLQKLNGEQFAEFNNARGLYMDYSHDTYMDNPSIYEKIGWDQITYNLVNGWCFIIDEVNTESFMYIYNNSTSSSRNVNRVSALKSLYYDKTFMPCFISFAVLVVISLINSTRNNNIVEALFIFAVVALSGFLFLYIVYLGRVLYRSLMVFMIPSFFILYSEYIKTKNNRLKDIIIVLIFIALSMFTLLSIFDINRTIEVESYIKKNDMLNEYAINNNNNIYIRDHKVTKNLNPRAIYVDVKPINVITWGGSTYLSDSWNIKMKANNIESLNWENFLDDNIYFVSYIDVEEPNQNDIDNNLYYMYEYLNKRIKSIYVKRIDKICDDVIIYKFVTEVEDDTYVYDGGWIKMDH